jgi:hypothetical protein
VRQTAVQTAVNLIINGVLIARHAGIARRRAVARCPADVNASAGNVAAVIPVHRLAGAVDSGGSPQQARAAATWSKAAVAGAPPRPEGAVPGCHQPQ